MKEIFSIKTVGLWAGFLISATAAVMLFHLRSAAKRILLWPQVKARLIPGALVFQKSGWLPIGNRLGLRISSAEFEYEIDGCTHRSRKLLPVNWTIRESEKERVQRELETVAVAFCNPMDPTEAFLDIPDRWQRGSISWVTVGLIVAVIMSGLMALMLLSKQV
jgi:hypothetical protein